MASPSYEHVYGSVLLDEIHNYFPALLYEPSRFPNVPTVLAYVQQQTQRHFNLFARGHELYNRVQTPPIAARRAVTAAHRNVYITTTRAPDVFDEMAMGTDGGLSTSTAAFLNALLHLGGATGAAAPRNFLTPVIVRPTAAQITAGVRDDLVGVTSDICAICQDSYETGVQRRTLITCNHGFHRGCIDTWLEQNVHCPVCRHDIREVGE